MNNQSNNQTNQTEEIFKQIPGFEDFAVSSYGRIMRLKNSNFRDAKAGMFKKPQVNKTTGYCHVKISGTQKARTVSLHRLVAEAFVPNPLGLKEVDHINRNKQDNRAENLRWVTRSENMRNLENRNCREVVAYPPNGGEPLRFDSIASTAEYIQKLENKVFLRQGISNVLNLSNKYTTYKGWKFSYIQTSGKKD